MYQAPVRTCLLFHAVVADVAVVFLRGAPYHWSRYRPLQPGIEKTRLRILSPRHTEYAGVVFVSHKECLASG